MKYTLYIGNNKYSLSTEDDILKLSPGNFEYQHKILIGNTDILKSVQVAYRKLLIELFFWYGVLKILEGISCFISLIVNINTATFEFKDIILKMLFCLSLGIIIIKITYSRIDFSFLLGR